MISERPISAEFLPSPKQTILSVVNFQSTFPTSWIVTFPWQSWALPKMTTNSLYFVSSNPNSCQNQYEVETGEENASLGDSQVTIMRTHLCVCHFRTTNNLSTSHPGTVSQNLRVQYQNVIADILIKSLHKMIGQNFPCTNFIYCWLFHSLLRYDVSIRWNIWCLFSRQRPGKC